MLGNWADNEVGILFKDVVFLSCEVSFFFRGFEEDWRD